MMTPLPEIVKHPDPQQIQDFLNAVSLYLKEQSQIKLTLLEQQGETLEETAAITDQLSTSLFQQISTESLTQIGNHLLHHPEAIAVASNAALGVPPHPVTVGALGLMQLAMSSIAASSIVMTTAESVKNFVKEHAA